MNKRWPARKQNIGFWFEYAGMRRCIPAIYRFPEEIVFDILTILDEAELRAFHDKYHGAEETLTPSERRAVEDEHPYRSVPLKEIKINDRPPLTGWSSTSSFHVPWAPSGLRPAREAKDYKRQLGEASCFACERCTVPLFPKPASKLECLKRYLLPEQIKKIEIETFRATRFLPIDLSFTLPASFPRVHAESFTHPKTQIPHTLYFQRVEREEIQIPVASGKKTLHIAQLFYEINPELPEGDHLQFDSSLQWEPERVEINGFEPHSFASIGIIGGSDGPTAMFISARDSSCVALGVHGLPLRCCIARPSSKAEATINAALQWVETAWLDAKTFSWAKLHNRRIRARRAAHTDD